MIYSIKLNNNDLKIYRLTAWDASNFNSTLQIKVQSSDLGKVSSDFQEIERLEVFQDDVLIATFTDLDTYDEITYIKNEYVPGEGIFADALRLHLTKTNIVTQVQRLDEQINPVIDVERMTIEETKLFKIKELGAICRAEIYAGDDVTLSDGSVKHYTYDADDQANVLSAITLAFAAKQMGFDLQYIPFHASGSLCELHDTLSMVSIYMTLQLKLTRLTTKCNMFNCMIRTMNTKEDILAVSWTDQLPEEYQQRYDEIMTVAVATAEAMAEAMKPHQSVIPDDDEEDDGEDTTNDENESENEDIPDDDLIQ